MGVGVGNNRDDFLVSTILGPSSYTLLDAAAYDRKNGPYMVFMTPPSTPKPAVEQPVFDSPKKIVVPPPPPVQPPP
uniref:Uncharacterized protein n=1 Tax=Fagus sylvatica TaxID=28930 RepID=A0A2N9EGC4_FAGSY